MADETGLIFKSADTGPGLHVLLVGVSDYPNLAGGISERADAPPLHQLDSAARTVSEIADWLMAPATVLGFPLRTCRLLASPSDAERMEKPALADALPATSDNLQAAALAWRDDAATSRDGATLFYFAGHGIQRSRGDSLLLLSDFFAPGATLAHTVDLSCIYDGMGEPDFADMAQTQFYFVDACRTDLPKVQRLANRSAPSLWDVTMGGGDDRIAPIFFAAAAGHATFGSIVPGKISAYGADVLRCLEGGAAELIRGDDGMARWTVTIGSMARALRQLVGAANTQAGRKLRSFAFDKWTEMDARLAVLPAAPIVDCTLLLDPPQVAALATVDLARGTAGNLYSFAAPLANPHVFRAEAGGYLLRATVPADCDPPFGPLEEIVTVQPPAFTCPVRFR